MKNIFVFDLDSTVVEALTYREDATNQDLDNDFGIDFRQAMAVNAYGYTHMVFPGFYELFRWINSRGDLIYFYSTGIEERNTDLVPRLMEKSFGNRAKEVLSDVKIFSRHQCINTEHMSDEESDKYQPGNKSLYGRRKKKLEGIVVTKQELPWTVLIDDDPSYTVKGEEENFFYVPGGAYYYVSSIYKDAKEYIAFHKAYYIRGFFERALVLAEENDIPLIKAVGIVKQEFESCEYDIKLKMMMPYLDRGLELLRESNPDLRYYLKKPERLY